MKIKTISILSLTLTAALLCGCHNNDDINRDNPYSNKGGHGGSGQGNSSITTVYGKSFSDIFGSPDPQHTWNQAMLRYLDVKLAAGAGQLNVYVDICNRCYLLATVEKPKTQERLTLNVPLGVSALYIVVDGKEYVTTTDVIDTTVGGSTVWRQDIYSAAEPLGWIYAADEGTDFDFNDAVFRIVPLPSGDVEITAMAIGTRSPIWLHYKNGSEDYTITPKAYNGYWIDTRVIERHTASMYHVHNWFSAPDELMSSGYPVNTLATNGANFISGSTVTIPAEELGEDMNISLQYIGLSSVKLDGKKHQYANPESGFYVTKDVYDIAMIDKINSSENKDYEICQSILCPWPSGYQPCVIVVPDVSDSDNRDRHIGWQWPSEGSRIDMTYPSFTSWVKDPMVPWSVVEASGWDDRQASLSSSGMFMYYGYYPR